MIEGRIARFVYISLYRMHQIALHGYIKTGLMMLVGQINRILRPRLKLHWSAEFVETKWPWMGHFALWGSRMFPWRLVKQFMVVLAFYADVTLEIYNKIK